MFSAVSKPSNKVLPLAIGGAAVACAAFFATRAFNPVKNDSLKAFPSYWNWVRLPVAEVELVSPDTKRFTFKLPSDQSELGLKLCSALLTKFVNSNGKAVLRPYTPVSDLDKKGTLQLVVKRFPNGEMSNHFWNLKPSDTMLFKGPIPSFSWKENAYDSITLLGAGSGITPLYQLVYHLTKNPNEKTKINLFYGNKTPQDILLKKELDDLQKKYPEKLKVTYFVDKAEGDFKGETGFITKEFLEKNAPKPSENTHVFVCGPAPFMKAYSGEKPFLLAQGRLSGILSDLGYSKNQVSKF